MGFGTGLVAGCSSKPSHPIFRQEFILGKMYYVADPTKFGSLQECVTDQVKLYGDLCAESTTAYEAMDGTDAHFECVKCAAEAIRACQAGEL